MENIPTWVYGVVVAVVILIVIGCLAIDTFNDWRK